MTSLQDVISTTSLPPVYNQFWKLVANWWETGCGDDVFFQRLNDIIMTSWSWRHLHNEFTTCYQQCCHGDLPMPWCCHGYHCDIIIVTWSLWHHNALMLPWLPLWHHHCHMIIVMSQWTLEFFNISERKGKLSGLLCIFFKNITYKYWMDGFYVIFRISQERTKSGIYLQSYFKEETVIYGKFFTLFNLLTNNQKNVIIIIVLNVISPFSASVS